MKKLLSFALLAFALLPASLHAINISGGGTNTISTAINANTTNGATLVIQDSLTYTETQALIVGRRYNGTARRSINIEVAPGQNPTIVLQGAGAQIVTYAGAADVYFGSSAGGKLTVDATAGGNPSVWYIGQEDGLASGMACQFLVENTEFLFGSIPEPIIFGAGGNDGAPLTTSASLTLNNVTARNGGVQVKSLYGPASYASTININDSFFYNPTDGSSIELGAYGLGGANSAINVDHTIVYSAPGSSASGDPNAILQRLGKLSLSHCDVLSIIAPATGRAATATTGDMTITDSILHASGAGVANFGAGTCTATDSNVSGDAVDNAGFTLTNTIREYPVYWSIGTDPDNLDEFAVPINSLSRTHGSTPPIGARGPLSVPVELSAFELN